MPLWIGKLWDCKACGFLNAVIRKACRNCGVQSPPPVFVPLTDETTGPQAESPGGNPPGGTVVVQTDGPPPDELTVFRLTGRR